MPSVHGARGTSQLRLLILEPSLIPGCLEPLRLTLLVCVLGERLAGGWVGGDAGESACVLRALNLWGFSRSREGRGGVSPVYWTCDEAWLGQWGWKEAGTSLIQSSSCWRVFRLPCHGPEAPQAPNKPGRFSGAVKGAPDLSWYPSFCRGWGPPLPA